MYFMMASVMTALAAQAVANPAITVTQVSDNLYDVAANITTLEAPELVGSWDILAYSTFLEPVFTDVSHLDNLTLIEMVAAMNLGSGIIYNSTDDCEGGIGSAYAAFVASETTDPSEIQTSNTSEIYKRFWYMSRWVRKAWNISRSNVVKAGALGALSDMIAGSSSAIIELTRSAICYTHDGNQACLSWTGGTQAIVKGVALQIIENAKGAFGSDAVSGQETAALFNSNSNKRDLTKRNGPYNVCVSNRPNHCT